MKSFISLFFTMLFLIDLFGQIEIESEVHISRDFQSFPIVEAHLSIHPENKELMFVSAMKVNNIDNAYQSSNLISFFSEDAGKNWTSTDHDFWGYDPWSEYDQNGNLIMAWLGTNGRFRHEFPLNIFHSNDGGKQFTDQIQSISSPHGHDGTKMTSFKNKVYLSTVEFNDDMSADVVVYQGEFKNEFKEFCRIKSQGMRLNFCEPVALSNGKIVIPASHYLRKAWVQIYDPQTERLSDKNIISHFAGGGRGYMRLCQDHSKEKYNDRLYFVRALSKNSGKEGVWINYSSDGGNTWSNDIKIDQHSYRDSRPLLASPAVNEKGVLGIAWCELTKKDTSTFSDIYFAYSKDGGETFTRTIKVNPVTSQINTIQNGDVANKFPGGGHYMDLKADRDGYFKVLWSDSRTGIFQLYLSTIKIIS